MSGTHREGSMTNTYTAWAIRLKDGSLVPAMQGLAGPLLLETNATAKSEVHGRACVGMEPGKIVKVTFTVREVAK